MMICVNLAGFVIGLPVAIIAGLSRIGEGLFLPVFYILGIIFMPALTYYVFTKFYGEQ